jgi:hypothetical protein
MKREEAHKNQERFQTPLQDVIGDRTLPRRACREKRVGNSELSSTFGRKN